MAGPRPKEIFVSMTDGAPGIPLEGARVVKPEHEAEHARHQAVLAALGRIEALLGELLAEVRGGGPESAPPGPSRKARRAG